MFLYQITVKEFKEHIASEVVSITKTVIIVQVGAIFLWWHSFLLLFFNCEICVKYVSKIKSNILQNLCVFPSKHANSPYQVWRSVELWTRWWQIVVVYNFPVIFRIFIILLCNTFRVIMVKDITFICSWQNTKQWPELEA